MSSVLLERRDAIAIIRLNRPEKFNALSREMLENLSAAFKQVEDQADLRAVILTGSGETAFCAGTNINELAGLDQNASPETAERGQALYYQIGNFPLPVIAAINGIAAGRGCELALACHLRIASTNAEFSLSETNMGVTPGYGGTRRLPHEIGAVRAVHLMLTGKVLSAAEVYQLGLINRVTNLADLFAAADSLAKEISLLAPLAVRACLRAVTHGLELPLQEGLGLETELFSSLFSTEDMREGTHAFLEKRTAIFKGT